MADDTKKESWHVGKEIPIAMLFAIMVQSCTAIWWAATLTAKLDDLSYQVAALSAEKYTKSDAEKDQRYLSQRITDTERRLNYVERRGK
jgi:cell division protein FtsB